MTIGTGLLSKDIKLSYSAIPATTYTVLPDLQEIPELGGSVEKVEITTLADGSRRYINGLKDYGDLVFKFLYNNEDANSSFRILSGFEGVLKSWKITLPDSTTFTFTGESNVKIDGVGSNSPLTFSLSISLNSEMTITNPA